MSCMSQPLYHIAYCERSGLVPQYIVHAFANTWMAVHIRIYMYTGHAHRGMTWHKGHTLHLQWPGGTNLTALLLMRLPLMLYTNWMMYPSRACTLPTPLIVTLCSSLLWTVYIAPGKAVARSWPPSTVPLCIQFGPERISPCYRWGWAGLNSVLGAPGRHWRQLLGDSNKAYIWEYRTGKCNHTLYCM